MFVTHILIILSELNISNLDTVDYNKVNNKIKFIKKQSVECKCYSSYNM